MTVANFFAKRTPGAPSVPAGATASETAQVTAQQQPWVEKYRPKTIKDVSSQEEAVGVLRKALESDNLPHLLFYGPPGTGKTSTILALARELFGPVLIKSRVLELNASDERGISIIREKVKNFAKTTVTNPVEYHLSLFGGVAQTLNGADRGYPCPPYKIIILDEADSMTNDAQSALRRTMETYSKMTRFCLICNYVTRIIDPLASRCAKFRFKPLPAANIANRLNMICTEEGVQCAPDAIETLVKTSEGDLRRAVTYLQTASKLGQGEPVSSAMIAEISGVIPEQIIAQFFDTCGSSGFEAVEEAVRDLILSGYSGTQFLVQLHDYMVASTKLRSAQKAKIALRLGEVDKCLTDGADEHLQLLNLASYMMTVAQS